MQKRDFETYQKRFRDFEILLKFSKTHVFRGTIRHQEPRAPVATPYRDKQTFANDSVYLQSHAQYFFFY